MFELGVELREIERNRGEDQFALEGSLFDFEKVGLKVFSSFDKVVRSEAFYGEAVSFFIDSEADMLVVDPGELDADEDLFFAFEDIDFGHPSALACERACAERAWVWGIDL